MTAPQPAATSPMPRSVTRPKGFRAAGITCGIKVSGKPDLMLIAADRTCSAAGVFTRNQVVGAPVTVSREHLKQARGRGRAMICNSGCSNVATGEQGLEDARTMCAGIGSALGIPTREVLVCSTGVIGRLLPMAKITPGLQRISQELAHGPAADQAAARAILTTDLVAKATSRSVKIGGQRVTLGGIAKGSGMIAPNMATMLAFLTTDAVIAPALLQAALRSASAASFNRITVDSDTSTSDAALILASGAADHAPLEAGSAELTTFTDALTDLCQELAYEIIRDGEGATKIFRVRVKGARNLTEADQVGRTVADSPLVKTAVHGGDPNWGRLAAATGRAGAKFDSQKLAIYIEGIPVYESAVPIPQTPANIKKLEKAMAKREIRFTIDLGMGEATCEWLGCDLSREYIAINADYTT